MMGAFIDLYNEKLRSLGKKSERQDYFYLWSERSLENNFKMCDLAYTEGVGGWEKYTAIFR